MEKLWSYKELKEVRLNVEKPSEDIARHLNQVFHKGEAARNQVSVEKVKRTLNVLFR